jgi:hypothetical protein
MLIHNHIQVLFLQLSFNIQIAMWFFHFVTLRSLAYTVSRTYFGHKGLYQVYQVHLHAVSWWTAFYLMRAALIKIKLKINNYKLKLTVKIWSFITLILKKLVHVDVCSCQLQLCCWLLLSSLGVVLTAGGWRPSVQPPTMKTATWQNVTVWKNICHLYIKWTVVKIIQMQ